MAGVVSEVGTTYTLEHEGSLQVFGGGRVGHLDSFLCCVGFFVFCLSSSCVVLIVLLFSSICSCFRIRQTRLHAGLYDNKTVLSLNFPFRYIYDVLSLNNATFCDYVDRFYSIDRTIKYTTDTSRSDS